MRSSSQRPCSVPLTALAAPPACLLAAARSIPAVLPVLLATAITHAVASLLRSCQLVPAHCLSLLVTAVAARRSLPVAARLCPPLPVVPAAAATRRSLPAATPFLSLKNPDDILETLCFCVNHL